MSWNTNTKERPICRRQIIKLGLRPAEVARRNGCLSIDPEGRKVRLSDGMAKQMRKMAAEGYWGEQRRRSSQGKPKIRAQRKFPQLTCDACSKRIENPEEGNVVWKSEKKPIRFRVVHKRCDQELLKIGESWDELGRFAELYERGFPRGREINKVVRGYVDRDVD